MGNLKQQARTQNVIPWIRFEGWVDEGRLERLYDEATGTICPSRYEGYGLAVAQSIARGLPTVASDIPSHREIADGAALFFPPGDAAALAQCLERLHDASGRQRLAEGALERAHALTRFERDVRRPCPAGR